MRVACYTRVSTEEQARHGISLEAQRAALEEFANANKYTIVDFYTDEGISARKPVSKRPELQRLLADVRAGLIDLIIFCKLDRWTRNVREYHKCQEVLEQFHVPWRAVQEDYETETAAGRFKVNIMLAVAEDEADRTSERIKFVFEQKRAKKEALTGNCPTGYKLNGKKIVKDENAPAVSAFFKKYLETASVWEAREAARALGLPLQYQLARKMLRSPCYYGEYYGTNDMCEPYISRAQFEVIQTMFPRQIKKNSRKTYILSGLVICGACGRRMGGKSNAKTTKYYNCVSHYADHVCPNSVNISERVLERYLLEQVEPLMRTARESVQSDCSGEISAEIEAIKVKINRLTDLYVNDLITLDEMKLRKAKFENEIEALRKDLPQAMPRVDLQPGWREMYETLSEKERQQFWRILIDRIIIDPDRTISISLK